ncbi:MAG TPA: hypothetical protein PLX17_03760 [Chitinophagaceae bacterium]|nr:hypothetical protein [Chitinophagaceae bacterium]
MKKAFTNIARFYDLQDMLLLHGVNFTTNILITKNNALYIINY